MTTKQGYHTGHNKFLTLKLLQLKSIIIIPNAHAGIAASFVFTNGQTVQESAGVFQACVALNEALSTGSITITVATQAAVNTERGQSTYQVFSLKSHFIGYNIIIIL